MSELLRNKFFTVTRFSGSPMIEVRRSAETFDSIEDMRAAFGELNRVLDEAGRIAANLFVDTREARPRNDPAFELAFEPLRATMVSGFRRVAVLVKTTAGRLQAERHTRKDGVGMRVFTVEADARLYCTRTR